MENAPFLQFVATDVQIKKQFRSDMFFNVPTGVRIFGFNN